MEQDPNLAMSRLVSQSRNKNEAGATATPPAPPKAPETPPPAAPPAPTPPAPPEPPRLTDLLQKSLRFGSKGAPKTETPDPAAAPATPPPPAAPPAAPTTTPPEPPPKPKKPRKVAPAPIDPAAIVTAATTAATEAAVRAVASTTPPAAKPQDNLTEEDRHDYEVAEFMAKSDPRYRDAPKIILEQVRTAEEYASRWEAANPGKAFDPKDDEHNEFYERQQRPWSDREFRKAEAKMENAEDNEARDAETNKRMAALEADNARLELGPRIEQSFGEATAEMAKLVGGEIHKTLTTGGWDALHQQDPVTAQVLAGALNEIHPFVEAAIQIDDPRQRIRLERNNPVHQQWASVVNTGEARLVGVQSEDGRMFAKRADYVRMKPEQAALHWYLTTEMIIQGAVEYAAEQVKTLSEKHKKRLESLGYVRQTAPPAVPSGGGNGTPATPPPPNPPPMGVPTGGEKPVSPTVGSGAKIDDTGGAPRSGETALIKEITNILFRRA